MARLRTHPGEVLREEYLVPLGLSAGHGQKFNVLPLDILSYWI
jgi:plasmid maintenance system antidote protein VapI